ncbi:acyltransferase [Candidatus Methylopumilus universalis]|nr:acyltransferase [Candidatus Methylopumilus universalis]QDC90722.1 acyltransferase [Candidatus Methylopumilus universalis]
MSNVNNNNFNYRPDIDGLRALAVLAVVLFHAFPEFINGGFIGVDIFFVISGYLISSIILKNLENNTFSFTEFYLRRIKRIFPSLIIVLFSALCFAWFTLLDEEYQQLGKHAFGASTFTNNFMFWQERGYFDNSSDTKPLLHLWSLSIEEQFYVIWPLLLYFAFKWKPHLGKFLLFITIVFTILHFYIFHPDRQAAFYAPYARFYELLVGAFIAYKHMYSSKSNNPFYIKFQFLKSLIGLALIFIGIKIITKTSHFPGYYALLSPVLGSALIIDSSKESFLNKYFLSNKLMVWIGLISYPLYLWHWPLLSFATIIESQTPSVFLRFALVILAITLATLTYYFIEKPIRFGKEKKSGLISIGLVGIMFLIGIFGLTIYLNKGFPKRDAATPIIKNEGDVGHILFHEYSTKHFYLCTPTSLRNEALKWDDNIRCLQSKKDRAIDIAVIGDSHAEHLFIGIAEGLPHLNVVYYQQPTLPIMGNQNFDHIFDYVISDKNIKVVLLNAYWSNRKHELPKHTSLIDGLSHTIHVLFSNHKKIYILDDVPFFSFDPKQCKFVRPLSFKNNCVENKSNFDKNYQDYLPIFDLLKKNHEVIILNTAPLFCDEKNCSMEKNGKVLYRDDTHLNIEGSRYIGKFIADEMKKNKLF